MSNTLDGYDYTVLAFYFLLVLIIALVSTFLKKSRETTEGYFLAGRSVSWWAVGMSLFASNIGSFHFIGLAASGAASGIAVITYEWSAAYILLLLGWVFVPVYAKANVFTLPQYAEKRFNSKFLRVYLSVLALLLYCFTKISVDLFSGVLVLNHIFDINSYISVLILMLITGVYTLVGGLTAVIYTEVLQTIIMIGGALIVTFYSMSEVGGLKGLYTSFPATFNTSNTSCFDPNLSFHIFRPINDPQFPWLGLALGLPINSIWYWCTDQFIVQRVLGAKDKQHAQGGTIVAGFFKLLVFGLIVLPGMASRVLYTDDISCENCTNNAYLLLIFRLLPSALRGLMVAVVLAALMSSLASTFNSSSTLITIDVWQYLRPKAGNKELLIVGQIVVVCVMVVSVAWLPVISLEENGQLFVYIQIISSYLAPPIAVTFMCGLLWRRSNKWGAIISLIIGLILGSGKLILDLIYGIPDNLRCEVDNRPPFVNLNYLYFAVALGAICLFILIVTSCLTPSAQITDLHLYVYHWKDILPYREYFLPDTSLTNTQILIESERTSSVNENSKNNTVYYTKSNDDDVNSNKNQIENENENNDNDNGNGNENNDNGNRNGNENNGDYEEIDAMSGNERIKLIISNCYENSDDVIMNHQEVPALATKFPQLRSKWNKVLVFRAKMISNETNLRNKILKKWNRYEIFQKLDNSLINKFGMKRVLLMKTILLYSFAILLIITNTVLYIIFR